ncbi:MAG TPA: efflux RND transporter periplasmic adaptor subunit [Candidatus Binataceae bacterium]
MKRQLLVLMAAIVAVASSTAVAQPATPVSLQIPRSSQAGRDLVIVPVKRETMRQRISATAIIEPDAGAVAEISSVIPARVTKLVAQPGQYVKAGEPLAILSSVELGEAKTEYLKARSLEAITGQQLKREQELYTKKITPMKDLLDARAKHDGALAEYEASREKLRLLISPADLNAVQWTANGHPLSEFPLVSPIAGTLVKRDLRIGAMVDREGPAPLEVINLERVWVIANIFEHDLAGLRAGDRAEVTVEAYPNRRFSGRVTYIGDEVDRTTRAVRARIEVPNSDHVLKPGMFARAAIDADGAREVVVAPESAVYEIDGKAVVFVPAGDGRFSVRPVTLGGRGNETVEITAGLKPGDEVVAKGGLALKSLIVNNAAD